MTIKVDFRHLLTAPELQAFRGIIFLNTCTESEPMRQLHLEGILQNMLKFNRYDLVQTVLVQVAEHGSWYLPDIGFFETAKTGRQIGVDELLPARQQAITSKSSFHNPWELTIHRRSVVAFLLSGPGTTFTGVGRIGKGYGERPKIFLCPVAQGVVSRAPLTKKGAAATPPPKPYAVRGVGETAETEVYGTKVVGAIAHRSTKVEAEKGGKLARIVKALDDHGKRVQGMSSHDHLVSLIKLNPTYDRFKGDGLFCGFTVCKGMAMLPSAVNRYASTSASLNMGTFGSSVKNAKPKSTWTEEEKLADTIRDYDKYLPAEWLSQIMRVCDQLLALEADLGSSNIEEFCKQLTDPSLGKPLWAYLQKRYWSIGKPEPLTEEAVPA